MTDLDHTDGWDPIDLIGTEKAPLPGREAVCPGCNLVYWLAAPHDCSER